MKINFARFLSAAALLCISLASCKKNDVSQPSNSMPSGTQSLLTQATNAITDASNQQNADASEALGTAATMSPDSTQCRTVSFNPSRDVYPHLKTVDFGSGCTGPDGLTRSGKKLITVYANWKSASNGTLLTETTFSNFYVDSINVAGNVKIYIDSSCKKGPLALKIVTNKTFTDTKGNTSTFTGVTYWKQIAGDTTTTRTDNIYQITGSASGTEVLDGATALTWSSKTDPQNPVIKKGDCYYRSKGGIEATLKLATGSVFHEYLNYGDGTCDNKATLTINNGTPQEVTLPLRFWPISL